MFRSFFSALCLVLGLGVVAFPAFAAEMTAAERQALLDHLDRTRTLFLDEVAGLSEAQWQFKASEDRWSIAQCAEHIAKAEEFIRKSVEKILETPATPEQLAQAAGKTEKVLPLIVDRSQKFQAPEGLQPTEATADPAAIVKRFKEERKATVKLAKKEGGLRSHAGPHPAFETLDAYDWLLFLSGHTERHILQIREVKAAPGFPAV
ncbi:MAG: DinB family protein [Acidobacteria bacterium]|nr:DinB family protein [Acidobacteriota bacterium]